LDGTIAAALWGWAETGTTVAAGGATATVGVAAGIVSGIVLGMPSSIAGPEYDQLVFRTNPNKKGSTPNYKKPKSKNGTCSYKGPPPSDFDIFMMTTGATIIKFAAEAIEAAAPGPPPNTWPGRVKGIFDLFFGS
jgi:hypothetical protein